MPRRRKQYPGGPFNFVHDLPDWQAFVSMAESLPVKWKSKGGYARSEDASFARFSGTQSFPEAINLARQGWPEGLSRMRDRMGIVAQSAMLETPTWQLDVAGAFPIVPAAVAGSPAAMYADDVALAWRQPHVSLLVDMSYNWGVGVEAVLNHGAAILCLLDELEAAGTRVEIAVGFHVRGSGSSDSITVTAPFKSLAQPLDMDQAAFALTHPSVLRRLGFAYIENHLELAYSFGDGYGHAEPPPPRDGWICLSPPEDRDRDFEHARERVAREFLSQIEAAKH